MAKKVKKKSQDHKFEFGISSYTDDLSGPGPSRLTFDNLRNLAKANPFVAVAKNIIKQRVSKTVWMVKPLDRITDEDLIDELQPRIRLIESLINRPNQDSPTDTFRKLINVVLDDLLDIDQAAVEKVKNLKGEILGLYHIDGATMRPCIGRNGLFESPAYKQYLDSNVIYNPGDSPDATFELDDVMWFQVNPSGVNGLTGYGQSPVEMVTTSIMGGIQALVYNVSYFSESNIPPAVINLAKANPAVIKQFANEFKSQLQGKQWAVAFTNADNMEVKSLRPSNLEMEFYKLNRWLAQVVISAFGLSPKDFGITEETNRATAQIQDKGTTKSIASYLDALAEEFTTDLIGDFAKIDPKFSLIEFAWDSEDRADELRKRDGLQPLGIDSPMAPGADVQTPNDKTATNTNNIKNKTGDNSIQEEASSNLLEGDSSILKSLLGLDVGNFYQ